MGSGKAGTLTSQSASPFCSTLTYPWPAQDVADFEWVMWFTSFRNIIVFALSGHVLFAKLCTMAAPQVSRTRITPASPCQHLLRYKGCGEAIMGSHFHLGG